MKICAISDLHGCVDLNKLDIDGEILCIAGDFIPLSIQRNFHRSMIYIRDVFIPWANKLPVEKVFLVAGNHDFVASQKYIFESVFSGTKIQYLEDKLYKYLSKEGKEYSIYGTPWCHAFGNWAFMANDDFITEKYNKMPPNLDILITHDPPAIKDVGKITEGPQTGVDAGCKPLAEVIMKKCPKLVLSGHIHTGSHIIQSVLSGENIITLVNVSLLNENYEHVYYPFKYFIP